MANNFVIDPYGNVHPLPLSNTVRNIASGGLIQASDNNGIVVYSGGATVGSATISAGVVGGGFQTTLVQVGSGALVLSAGSGVTIVGSGSGTGGSGSVATLTGIAADTVYLGGKIA